MTHYFDSLGDTIASHWAHTEYDNLALPAIAADAMEARRPSDNADWRDIAVKAAIGTRLPPQPNIGARFGQPPITVFAHPRFYIEVLFWLEGSTDVHQHGFSGAFAVLAGTSIHTEYSFRRRRRVNGDLLVGDLRVHDATILLPGDVRPIVAGDHLIHAVYHLGKPSATVVVRTAFDSESLPQYTYFYPHLAVDIEVESALEKRRSQSMSLLWSLGADADAEVAAQAIRAADATSAFKLVCDARERLDGSEAYARIIESGLAAHGTWLNEVAEVAEERLRIRGLKHLANRARTPEQKLMIALLMTVPDIGQLRALIAREWPGSNPVDTLVDSLFSLAADGLITLGQDNLTSMILRYALEGVPPVSVVDRLEKEYGPEMFKSQRTALAAHCKKIRDMFFAAVPETTEELSTAPFATSVMNTTTSNGAISTK
jgi:hypothetical protein